MSQSNNLATLTDDLRYTPSFGLSDILSPGFRENPFTLSNLGYRRNDSPGVPLIGMDTPLFLDSSVEKSKGFDLVNRIAASNGLKDAFELVIVSIFTRHLPSRSRFRKGHVDDKSNEQAKSFWENIKSTFSDRVIPENLIAAAVLLLPNILQRVGQTVFEPRFDDTMDPNQNSSVNALELFTNMAKVTFVSDIEKLIEEDKSKKETSIFNAIVRSANLQAIVSILQDNTSIWKYCSNTSRNGRSYFPVETGTVQRLAEICYPILVEKYTVDDHPEFLLAAAYGIPLNITRQITESISFGSDWMTSGQSARAYISFLFDFVYSDA